jgi:hypothetical protein
MITGNQNKIEDVKKISFEKAKEEEFKSIQKLHTDKTPESLVGLAFSGGGIRSATFGLGVLEALKGKDLLKKIDYLSTVSGGGYIGAWLSANCKRTAERIEEQKLVKNPEVEHDWLHPDADWKESIQHLRRYSNYISPSLSLLSADTWSMATIWLRNTLLVQLMIIFTIACLLLVPRILCSIFTAYSTNAEWHNGPLTLNAVWDIGTIILLIICAIGIYINLRWLVTSTNNNEKNNHNPKSCISSQLGVLITSVFPLIFASLGYTGILWQQVKLWEEDKEYIFSFGNNFLHILEANNIFIVALIIIYLSTILLSFISLYKCDFWYKLLISIFAASTAIFVLVVIFSTIMLFFHDWSILLGDKGVWLAFVWGSPAVLGAFSLAVVILIGMQGRDSLENGREWWGRFAAWLAIYAFACLIVAVAAVYGPLWCAWLYYDGPWQELGTGWIGTTLAGLFAGKSASTDGKDSKGITTKLKEIIAKLTPFIFIAGLIIAISMILHLVIVVNLNDNYFKISRSNLLGDGCNFRMMSVSNENEQQNVVQEFQSEFESKKKVCAVLIVHSASAPDNWRIAGFNDEGDFMSKLIDDPNSELSIELKKKPDERKIIKLVTSSLGRTLGDVKQVSKQFELQIDEKSTINEIKEKPEATVYQSKLEDNNLKYNQHWVLLNQSITKISFIYCVRLFCLFWIIVLNWRVDINEFSLNGFYRYRLSRCFLGATRKPEDRKPNLFTGFDDDDDLKMAELLDAQKTPSGPLHIVNCALNLGGSSDLSLHTRHSANFTLTPLSCGSNYQVKNQNGTKKYSIDYVKTETYGGIAKQPTLGQAISVSGAAASPNMGYHTSAPVSFLMTLFNARLGWWFPNPGKSSCQQPSPTFSLWYLLKELFGFANEKSTYLAISDGGHFENLAAYELVKRRCRVIIISDGECDPKLQFEGLATLIRMCEVDNLVKKIEIDVRSIHPESESGWSRSRCAIGKIIYGKDESGNDIPDGWLIYLKASMNGHEDTALMQYKAIYPDFPHETTGDQFYVEDQFESYRCLGRDITQQLFGKIPLGSQPIHEIAKELNTIFTPELPNQAQFTRHTDQLVEIWNQLSKNASLKPLDDELRPSGAPERSVFYLCSEMIQLMENVYLEQNLEDTWEHPDNQGWKKLFKQWAKSSPLKDTWELTNSTYGERFKSFWDRKIIK